MILSHSDNTHPLVMTGCSGERDDDCACPDGTFVLAFDTEHAELDNDCACPDGTFMLKAVEQEATLYIQAPDVHTDELPNTFHLAFSAFAPNGPSVLDTHAWARWQEFATPGPLLQPVDRLLADQRLIQPLGARFDARGTPPTTLTAWLHVTNACNLDCPYCYVRKSSARMSEAIGLHAIEQIFRTAVEHGFRRVKLKYAGGEATLHFRLIRQLHERARELADATGLELREVVLSNGVRIRLEDADWLVESGVKLMISLDGVGEAHNQQRPLKGGGGTFDAIAATVDGVLLPRGIRPDITITITQRNASGATAAVEWALKRDLPVSLNFYRQNMLSASRADLALEENTIIDGMLSAYQVFERRLPTRPFFNGLLDRVQGEAHSHTCGVGLAYLVVTHEGRLAQCQMHLDAPVSPSLDDNIIPLIGGGPIRNLSVDEKTGCRSCTYRYRCTGGCPLETFRATGRWDVSSPHCNIYKTLMPAALRLEGLRLLKSHGYLC
jgi:uncharacterized protein